MHCDIDCPKLYDLSVDLSGTKNLAKNLDFRGVAKQFAKEMAGRWDGETPRQKVIATQKSCGTLHRAMQSGGSQHLDYNPPSDASG